MDLDAIKKEYSKRKHKYEKLKEEVKYIIEEELKAANIPYHMLDGRVKTLDSLLAKVQRQSEERPLEGIDEIVDICGVRIICLFLSDIEKIGKIIEEKLDIETKDDKVLSKPQEEFGYLSVHYVGKLPPSFSGPRYDDIKHLRFEMQVRTIAMHAWSTISHYLDYKSPHSVPSDLRKDFSSLSALFYLADSHFELFFRNSRQAKQLVERKARRASGIHSEEINLDTIKAYLKQRFPKRIRCFSNAVSKLVEELIAAGYKTIGDLDADLQRSMHAFELYEKAHHPTGKQFGDVGVVRGAISIANNKYRKSRKLPVEWHKRFESFQKYLK